MADIPTIEEFADDPRAPATTPAKRAGPAGCKADSIGPTQSVAAQSTAPAPALSFFSFRHGQQYYANGWRKTTDFFVGLLGVLALYFLVSVVRYPFSILLGGTRTDGVVVVFAALFVAGVVCSFVFGRRWIGFGMLASIGVALLLLALLIIAFLGGF